MTKLSTLMIEVKQRVGRNRVHKGIYGVLGRYTRRGESKGYKRTLLKDTKGAKAFSME